MIHTAHVGVGSVPILISPVASFCARSVGLPTHCQNHELYAVKNVTYVLITFWFGCFCGFSGQPLILDVVCQSFYVLYTSVTLTYLLSVRPSFRTCMNLVRKMCYWHAVLLWPWILNSVWHSIVIFFVSSWALEVFGLSTHDQPVIATNSGKSGGLTTLGFVVFTNLVVVVNLKLFLETFMLTWHFLLAIAVSILLWFAVGFPFRNQMLDFHKLLAKWNT
ncbi:hypothetical protein PsorP6_006463 [Peronosclerospora sorghi]|uniref:Uncharacterized protein n=1 Tax=Peronosclerospora sorghi TaxID=230839 RepID=A0ACC0W4V3_9STRA|nr:hypothetical protein PsorP6_006463 [Peronosclerospora sorghi]